MSASFHSIQTIAAVHRKRTIDYGFRRIRWAPQGVTGILNKGIAIQQSRWVLRRPRTNPFSDEVSEGVLRGGPVRRHRISYGSSQPSGTAFPIRLVFQFTPRVTRLCSRSLALATRRPTSSEVLIGFAAYLFQCSDRVRGCETHTSRLVHEGAFHQHKGIG